MGQFGISSSDYPSYFPATGQWSTPLYAISRPGVTPSRFATWFQANEACLASGKRLPFGFEWQTANRATVDPGVNDGNDGSCQTTGTSPRGCGSGIKCQSVWGAQDMIGSLYEWTADWSAGVGNLMANVKNPYPANYGQNHTLNVDNLVNSTPGTANLPSAILRGGSYLSTDGAGNFAYCADSAPTRADASFGFRCLIPN